MKTRGAVAACILALAGCAPPGVNTVRLGNSVLCGPTEVIMPSQAVTSLVGMVGEAEYGSAVCKAVAGIDSSAMLEPTRVTVLLPTGETIVRLRARPV
jgi:hypothetical protein